MEHMSKWPTCGGGLDRDKLNVEKTAVVTIAVPAVKLKGIVRESNGIIL